MSASSRSGIRTDRGSTTVFAAGLALVLVTVSTIALLVTTAVLAGHKARAAADLSALAGATAMAAGVSACQTADRIAAENGATVDSCGVEGTQASFVVSVTVSVETGLRPPLPTTVHAEAHAGDVAR